MSENQLTFNPDELQLVLYPHAALSTKSEPVAVTESGFLEPDLVKNVAERMTKILSSLAPRGIGLAANQVGLTWRMFVCMDNLNDPKAKDRPIRTYINPRILSIYGGLSGENEGCLSFPGINGLVLRQTVVHLSYLDIEGKSQDILAPGLQARCYLHECDHLDGVNIVDKFSDIDRKRIAPQLRRIKGK